MNNKLNFHFVYINLEENNIKLFKIALDFMKYLYSKEKISLPLVLSTFRIPSGAGPDKPSQSATTAICRLK